MAKKALEKKVRFVDNGDGTISDTETGLMWQKEHSEEYLNFKDAEKYCKNSKVGNYKDWRLPTLKELFLIADHTKKNPAIDPIFKCKPEWFWTSTLYAGDADGAWIVYFSSGRAGWRFRAYFGYVRPVRQISN